MHLTYGFSPFERELISRFHLGSTNEFDIKYRKILACAFAAKTWAPLWRASHAQARLIHIHFRFDNTTAISWQLRMASRNTRVQLLIRLLGVWELQFGLRFSASHIPGSENTTVDAGSRRWGDGPHALLFAELARGWSQTPTPSSIEKLETAWQGISANTPLLPHPFEVTPGRSATGSCGPTEKASSGTSTSS